MSVIDTTVYTAKAFHDEFAKMIDEIRTKNYVLSTLSDFIKSGCPVNRMEQMRELAEFGRKYFGELK